MREIIFWRAEMHELSENAWVSCEMRETWHVWHNRHHITGQRSATGRTCYSRSSSIVLSMPQWNRAVAHRSCLLISGKFKIIRTTVVQNTVQHCHLVKGGEVCCAFTTACLHWSWFMYVKYHYSFVNVEDVHVYKITLQKIFTLLTWHANFNT